MPVRDSINLRILFKDFYEIPEYQRNYSWEKSDEIEPLLSRFFIVEIPEYTFEEFKEIAVARLRKENVDKILAVTIAEKVWTELGSSDVRDVVKVARLASNIQEVSSIVRMMKRQIHNSNSDSQRKARNDLL